MDNYIEHYGVPGMKWGIRRYQNYNGSYTKAGLKRYSQSKARADSAREAYRKAKLNKNNGSGTKEQIKAARRDYKEANRQMIKDYRHLKADKLGDEGKKMYSEGKRITSNNTRTRLILLGTGLATRYAMQNGKEKDAIKIIAAGAAVEVGARAIEEYQNRRLRAYYGHTSNY